MNFFSFGATPVIEIILDGEDKRKLAEIKTEDGKKEKHLLYYDGETVSGQVKITLKSRSSKFEHQGIRIDLIGQIELFYDRGNQYTFLSLYKELARPGELLQHQIHRFEFANVEKLFESYTGTNCQLKYFLRVSIMKRLTDIVKERELVVHTLSQYPDMNNSIKMEVGIEDCLHIEFEYNRSKYHLNDVIVGKIYFLLVRIKIKFMELSIIKRETTGSGPNVVNENETITRYEIMDGAPVRGESIPIRVFLAGYDLTPTFKDVNRKFSVRYYLNLVLVDEEDRRYFKQQEIILWRKIDKPRKTFQASLQQQHREMQNPNSQVFPSTSSSTRRDVQSVSSNGSAIDAAGAATSMTAEAMTTNQGLSIHPELVEEAIAAIKISNGTSSNSLVEDNDATDGKKVDDDNSDDVSYRSPPQRSTNSAIKKGTKNRRVDKSAHFVESDKQSPFAAGTSKTLDGDDSDDDVPKLTGSICQADVHNSSHDLGADTASTEDAVVNLGKEE